MYEEDNGIIWELKKRKLIVYRNLPEEQKRFIPNCEHLITSQTDFYHPHTHPIHWIQKLLGKNTHSEHH